MSAAFYPVLRDSDSDIDATFDGKALSRVADSLDRIARDAGVPPLTGYVSVGDDEYGVFEDAGLDVPTTVWFAAGDGLRTVRALLAGIQPADANATVLSELRSLESILHQANEQRVEWRLAVDL
jgi:hypothetical protein